MVKCKSRHHPSFVAHIGRRSFLHFTKVFRTSRYPPLVSMAEDAELGAFPGLTPTDRENLAGGDENFKPHNWEDLKEIIGDIYSVSVE